MVVGTGVVTEEVVRNALWRGEVTHSPTGYKGETDRDQGELNIFDQNNQRTELPFTKTAGGGRLGRENGVLLWTC